MAWCVGEMAIGKYRISGDLDVFNTPYLTKLKSQQTIILLYYIVVQGDGGRLTLTTPWQYRRLTLSLCTLKISYCSVG